MAIVPNIRVILASSSPRRQELLQSLGVSFDVQPPQVTEDYVRALSPPEIVEDLSRRKALAVARTLQADQAPGDALVIGSDTVVVLDGDVLGQPADAREAQQMLARLQGRGHRVYTGLALITTCTDGKVVEEKSYVGHRCTEVYMRQLSEAEIDRYVATEEPLDKAGAYAIQGFGATFVDKIVGDYFTVVGLPLTLLAKLLRRAGYRLF
ncbi:Maf family protein [Numidum massiliense]|uniref:Maf family protein n=1 Tax=Numidum massiliense TaxID=1522315 RepID=UPI0006D599A4|nr:Maf family protein [Numidum massiliense]